MSTCRCGKTFRVGRQVYVKEGRKLVRERMCLDCASGAVLIYTAEPSALCRCGNPATKCHVCATKALERDKSADVATAVQTITGWLVVARATPYTTDATREHRDGRIEGLEAALELLKGGRFA